MLNLKSILLLNKRWNHTIVHQMNDLASIYSNNDVLLFLLQISKQPHRMKCYDQLEVKKRDTDGFENLHEKTTKLSVM